MGPPISTVLRLSTSEVPRCAKFDWLCDVIGREYVKVEISPPADGGLFNDMTIYPWEELRLSVIRSSAITIERLAGAPYRPSQDAYYAVVLLSGRYALEQQGREVFLKPGDISFYDATRPHRIHCPGAFAKLIVSIPRKALRERVAGIEHCTALQIPGTQDIGAVASQFIRATAKQAYCLHPGEFTALTDHCLDLLTMAVASVRPQNVHLSCSRSLSLHRVKHFVEQHLDDPHLDTAKVASGTGLSPRYLNDLLRDEDTTLMRYVWQRRLEQCRIELLDPIKSGQHLTQIAYRWGFNDMSHFSRAFKQRYACSPREYRQQAIRKIIPPE